VKASILALAVLLTTAGRAGTPTRTPVLVELFTSEGCSSCPPADELLARLHGSPAIESAEVIVLEEHVDYWDNLGWKDPFSSSAFTRRQTDYSTIFGDDKVYTPQMVVDGADEFIGSSAPAAERAIRDAAGKSHLALKVRATFAGTDMLRATVDAPALPKGHEAVNLTIAIVEDHLVSAVLRGENKGRTLSHAAVVRLMQTVGALDADSAVQGGDLKLGRGWKRENIRVIAFLQGLKSQRIYGASTAKPDK
jgi:hypothetical protein